MKSIGRIALAVLTSGFLWGGTALAQDYPSKPIQMIVPYSAGSGIDLLARIFEQPLGAQLKTTVVIENRDGATGMIGSTAAARAPNDGYTIMVNANPPFVFAPLSQPNPTYDSVTSFSPIARVGEVPMLMVTSSQSPVKTFAELKKYADADPSKSSYATNGNGSPAQLNMELIKASTGLKITEVPYKSTTQMMVDVAAGHVLATIISQAQADQFVQTGKLRVLAVGTQERLKRFADVPTMAELVGQKDFQAIVWYGFFAPAGTPPDRMTKLFDAISKVLANPKVTESMSQLSIIGGLQNPTEFGVSLRKDAESARKIVASMDKK